MNKAYCSLASFGDSPDYAKEPWCPLGAGRDFLDDSDTDEGESLAYEVLLMDNISVILQHVFRCFSNPRAPSVNTPCSVA